MQTYEYFRAQGKDDAWLERNIESLCGDCEMVRAPEYDFGSCAYIVDGYTLHICNAGATLIEAVDDVGSVLSSWWLE